MAVDVSGENKQIPDIAVLPRYWVTAREVHLARRESAQGVAGRVARSPYGLDCPRSLSSLVLEWCIGVPEGLRMPRLPRSFRAGLTLSRTIPSRWSLHRCRWVCAGNNPACIQPLGPSYLPAEPINEITAEPRSSTAWYAVDPSALRASFVSFAPYVELLDSVPSLQSKDEALAFAGGTPVPRLPPMAHGLEGHHQRHE